MSDPGPKAALRQSLVAARRQMSPTERHQRSVMIVDHLLPLLQGADNVAAYWPVGTEPGANVLIPALRATVEHVWLPVSLPDGCLQWAADRGDDALTTRGEWQIPEPAGPRHGNEVLVSADAIVLPALGATPTGVRLGKGAGYYDRALAQLTELGTRPGRPLLITVVFASEILSDIPAEAHDMPTDLIVTDAGVHRCRRLN